ncbi:glutaredoxin 3 [Fodinicurvata sp. EGI_FJ10296]|uniref:glutaredoxin 3 n=1 Tax=Fodinicurvata sp. EGI_FJ10296 TaxID=3231908 RepID=UPI003456DB15
MVPVTVYSSPFCSFCARAKKLLSDKGVSFDEIDVFSDAGRKKEMIDRAGGKRTVPQIFVGDAHVGGCDELFALDRQGRLDPLLAGSTLAGNAQ